jgi:aconitate hydratase
MIAVGAGGLDVAVAMALGTFTMTYPTVTRVFLTGQLSPWCSAKDVILNLLQKLTTKGNVGTVIEYGGPGILSLTVPERATITNMGAELGVTTSVFPSDEITCRFLEAQGHGDWWLPIEADLEANYDAEVKLDLSKIEPMVAQPHSPDNVVKIKDIVGLPADQVVIGSCTNSSYKDLMMAAQMLKGRAVHENSSLVVAPGSKQVLRMVTDAGGLSDLIASGARIAESTCGFCIGNSYAPGTDSVTVRTSNRNFLGRSGHKSAKIYLTSVEAAVATAITGALTDPRDLDIPYPRIEMPDRFTIDDSMLIYPGSEVQSTEIFRGPNIGEPPDNEPLKETLAGTVTIKVGDKITTDHIMPAGDKLKYRSNVPKYQ